jgi:Dolichyl-phosphate-mannose-protein mannosyltransferase
MSTAVPTETAIARVRRTADRLAAVPAGAVVAGALVLTAVIWAILQRAEPFLGHDESVYAGKARSLVTGAPAVGWAIYRPLGLPSLGFAALRPGLGHDTVVLRVIGLLLALGTLLVVYGVGARVTTPRRAAVAVLVVISGATFLRRMPEFLDDIPSAGGLLLTAYLVLRSRRPGGRWALPAAGATGAVSVLVRYGASAGILAIAVAAVLVWGPRVWLRAWREVLGAAAVLTIGLTPIMLISRQETGSLIGFLLRAHDVSHQDYLGDGLVYYVRSYPAKLAGALGAVVITVALVALARDARRLLRRCAPDRADSDRADSDRADSDRADVAQAGARIRERVFLGAASAGELVLLGLVAHGESRFALFTVLTLVVLGVDALAEAAGRRATYVLAATVAIALLLTGVTTVLVFRQMQGATAQVRAVASVASRLSSDVAPAVASRTPVTSGARVSSGTPAVHGASCLLVTRLPYEAAWAGDCDAVDPDALGVLPADATVYVITFPSVPGWSGLARARTVAPQRSWTLVPVRDDGVLGDAVVAVSVPAASPAGG